MCSKRKIEYIDLELETTKKGIQSLSQRFKLECQCQLEGQQVFAHTLHSNKPILNTLVDLLIALGSNIGQLDNNITQILIQIKDYVALGLHVSKEIENNVQYIKNQNNDMFSANKQLSSLVREGNTSLQHLGFKQSPNIKQLSNKLDQITQLLDEIKQLTIS